MRRTIILTTLLATGLCHGSTTLIDVSFPAGTGTNPTSLEIDNGVGSNSWTQASGVLSTSTNDNSAVAAASDTANQDES